ncbi:MAG: bifunctional folylpolyglutamate synthase/dihydrofolate synthase [Phycisphaeraceae bacterium]|nr:bifunctional folylpolyglutamate synthase/dihydrofolate synthase [Phycisphaeraceae bacterium]
MPRQGPSSNTRRTTRPAAQVEAKGDAPAARRGLPAIESYDDALANLMARVDLERQRQASAVKHAYKLDRMRAILAELKNPQDAVRCVHVAGTKGKGSTCEMTASCLQACGYAVGLYTSPHVVDIRERVRLNRRPITQADFARLARAVAGAAAAVEARHGQATFFEMMTAMAFVYFAEQAVDVAVIEVGLGGLLDCTNVITPEVSAVSLIGFDHTDILGNTLEEIALQKAGIFKPGVPALTIEQPPQALKAMREYAQKIGAPLQVVGEDIEFNFRFEFQGNLGPVARVSLTTERSNFEHVPVPLRGEHQAYNCGLALAVLDKLAERGFNCPEVKVARGLEQVTLPGRFEVIPGSPRLLLDVAHNPESVRALIKAIGAYLQYESLLVIFGCAADKDVDGMLRHLAMGADKVIFTRVEGNARAANPADLQRRYAEISGKSAQTAPSLRAALDLARPAVAREDLVCITGSFYLVGEAKRLQAEAAERAKARPAGRR